jgi:hypothetical protein
LSDSADNKLSFAGEAYFRTLHANGTPSTAPARPHDWRDILDICFDNREADIGRFLRRQLTGQDASRLLATFQVGSVAGDVLRKRCAALLQQGEESFVRAQKDRGLSLVEQALLDRLSWEIALAIDPPRMAALPDKEFLATFGASNPKYTGWPIWLDARSMTDDRSRPVVRAGAWEALIVALSDDSANRLEFSRLDPKGEFYLRRLLQDDAVPRRIEPGNGSRSDLIFRSDDGGPFSNMAMLAVLKRMNYGHVTVHGFQATFATWAKEQAPQIAIALLAERPDPNYWPAPTCTPMA